MIFGAAREADVDAIMELECGAFHPWERWGRQSWLDEMHADDRFVITARDADDRVMAAATFQCVADDADLHRIMVARQHRGEGAAKHMMRAGMEWARAIGAERMLLEVREDNDAAIALYETFDFEPISRRENYYGQGVHAILMAAPLAAQRPQGLSDDGLD
ncbi:GNAT family N-acetyltransferase [Luteococcus sp. Sow4_B9]|uniref:GNAT family N-acetyltransferase n=1 Tax=Luteococcus sp. Sow4_B9 TaxID=3438792 RepID=UPI003F9DC460